MIELNELGKRIAWFREKNFLSVRRVANDTKIAASTLSRIENGLVEPKIGTLVILADYYEVSIDYLIARNIMIT